MRSLHRAVVPAAALVLTGVLGACGGSASTSTTAASKPVAVSSSSSKPPTALKAVVGAGDGSRFCTLVAQQAKAVVGGTSVQKLVADGSPAAWKAYLDKARAQNQELTAVAPPEVKSDLLVLQQESEAMQTAFAKAGYDFKKLDVTTALKTMNNPQVAAAGKKLTAYAKTHCGVTMPSAM